MRSKLIFLVTVLVLLFGLIFIINKNRATREKIQAEMNAKNLREQQVKDSILRVTNMNNRVKKNLTNTTTKAVAVNDEDFNSYLNRSVNKLSGKTNIAVTILDPDGDIYSSLSSSVTDIYTKAGLRGINGLLRSSFTHQSSFKELFDGNADVIDKLKLINHTDYIALGKTQFTINKGALVNGTYVCNISLLMTIISVSERAVLKSFSLNAIGNGANELQAKEEAIQRLLNKYSNDYSTL